jgi:hypothetical protein
MIKASIRKSISAVNTMFRKTNSFLLLLLGRFIFDSSPLLENRGQWTVKVTLVG